MKIYLIAVSVLLALVVQSASGSSRRSASAGGGGGGGGGEEAALSNAAKLADKMTYPKKVTSLKKRPTKSVVLSSTPSPSSSTTSATATSATASSTAATTTTKSAPKATKATLKTTKAKKGADVTAAFKDLPADDLEFIKELDKQFKLHGGKIKIKVERDNATNSKNTNSKRTIDGQLGYGSGYHNGYEYNRPKFEFYPYSQQDIPSGAPGYYPAYEKTSVSIEPSYSYELKPQMYEEHHNQPSIDLPPHQTSAELDEYHHYQHPQQQQEPQYDEPVIVLRIPGPTKYASHLQTLLQQYLEIRAAQYLQILEQAELRKQPTQYPHYEPQSPQQHYESPAPVPAPSLSSAEDPHDYAHHQDVSYAHQIAPAAQPIAYPAIDDVYQTYKGRHQSQPQQQQEEEQQHVEQPQEGVYYTDAHAYHAAPHDHDAPQEEEEHQHQQQQPQPQYYYMHDQQEYVQMQTPADHSYQNVYFLAMSAQPVYEDAPQREQHHQPIYVQEEAGEPEADTHDHQQPAQDQHQQQLQHQEHVHQHHHGAHDAHNDGHEALPISENSPRTTHTKVIFRQNGEQGADEYATRYPLPSIRPYERHAPTSSPAYQAHYQHQHQRTAESGLEETHQETVAITQRPYNYHAHGLMAALRRSRKRGAANTPATTTPNVATAPKIVEQTRATVDAETDTADETDQQLDKIREYVRDNLGAKMGSTVEFKTTEALGG